MVLPLTSRFAVLSVDDDDDVDKKPKTVPKKKTDQSKQLPSQLKQKLQDLKKKKKPESQVDKHFDNKSSQQSLQQQSKTKPKSSTQRKKKSASADQWELWKEKDAKVQDGNYENELQQAMILSKLDFEEKKDLYDRLRKQQQEDKKTANTKKKKGKPQPMSLSEFNSLPDSLVKPQESGGGDADGGGVNGSIEYDPEFFERVQQDAKKVISNEKAKEQRRAREPFVNDAIAMAQFEDQIERKNKEILELKAEITRLKDEIKDVKQRNTTLCQILGQGEMKDKAEVLVQMEDTQKVKDELSTEVERLTALLEQERSKVRALSSDKVKGKNKKRSTESH